MNRVDFRCNTDEKVTYTRFRDLFMEILKDIYNRLDERMKSVLMFAAGTAAIIVFCLFARVAWPNISREPEMTLLGDAQITISAGTDFQDEGAKAFIRKKDVSDQIYVTGEVDTAVPGTYDLAYNVDGRWETYSVDRTVTVVDTDAPQITLNQDETVTVEKIEDYQEPGAVVIDNCDGDMSSALDIQTKQSNDYTYVVTYTVTDSSGNTATAQRQVILQDKVAPEITLIGEGAITIQEREKFADPGAQAVDDRDGDISQNVVASGFVDIYRPGSYTVTYTVSDAGGNQASVTRDVEVQRVNYNPENAMYLTFDDGPSGDVTPQILDTLAANHVQATFFICNYDESKIPIIKRMINEGHTIGIHGYSHEYAEIYASADAFMNNIYSLRDKLKNDTGYEAFCIRFPGGSSNAVSKHYCEGVMSQLVQRVTDENLMYVDWNASSHDAESGYHSPQSILENVKNETKLGRTNIVLMHDISSKQTTADALQSIIDYGKSSGFNFCRIEENTVPVHQTVQN